MLANMLLHFLMLPTHRHMFRTIYMYALAEYKPATRNKESQVPDL